ncbi:glyoxalase [Planktothrix sp. FACHB-1355]|uniref:Glyoxalase n=1 Tax=Aerosakkonema funiforme FACHB-1375 TaxID=2949571 RepID=A0A926VEM0_9CYAN|nr:MULTISPECIES: VOC family protein [Oscillatoriales]MBD2181049.1 glyoxalase [Aerosakkonema funiforme FACHB-1375]MBD3558700.1 glyoxalase [Planktothrix sp. FACHB-1355]
MFKGIQAVFYFVSDVVAAAKWYSELLAIPVTNYFESDGKIRGASIQIGDVEMFLHLADAKMQPGHTGQVAYWRVDHINHAIEQAQQHGARLYRGPLQIENNQAICQMWDIFGNLFGMQGNYS